MQLDEVFAELGVTGAACATAIEGDVRVGHAIDAPMTPASVVKVPIALAVHAAINRGDLASTLDGMAAEAGFDDYAALARHDPAVYGPPDAKAVRARLALTPALDPARGPRTTASDLVRLLQLVWTDAAAATAACAEVRGAMAHQLTRHRIASGFDADVGVAAKSGGLMGAVRNEIGVVTFPDGPAFAVAVLTRADDPGRVVPAQVDAGIGRVARRLVDELHG